MGLAKTVFAIRRVGLVSYIKTKLLARGTVIAVRIGQRQINVRSRTRDLSVAIDSLCQEYEGLSSLLPKGFDGLVIDAGGYIGTAAIRLAELFPHATVVSVEPSSENLGILRLNTAGASRIHVLHAALTSRDGQSVMLRDPQFNEWGFTLVDIEGATAVDLEEVRSISVAGLHKAFGKDVGFLKMDIEGAEVEVLNDEGLQSVAPSVLFVELHERTVPGCMAAFDKFGRGRANYKGSGEKYLSLALGIRAPTAYSPMVRSA